MQSSGRVCRHRPEAPRPALTSGGPGPGTGGACHGKDHLQKCRARVRGHGCRTPPISSRKGCLYIPDSPSTQGSPWQCPSPSHPGLWGQAVWTGAKADGKHLCSPTPGVHEPGAVPGEGVGWAAGGGAPVGGFAAICCLLSASDEIRRCLGLPLPAAPCLELIRKTWG